MIGMVEALAEAFKEPFNALGRWLNPDRKREARLHGAIEAASNLIALYEKTGAYKAYSDEKIAKYIIHYKKQFEAWRNG